MATKKKKTAKKSKRKAKKKIKKNLVKRSPKNIKKVKNTAVRTVVLRHLLKQEKAQSLKDIENALAYTDRSSIFRRV